MHDFVQAPFSLITVIVKRGQGQQIVDFARHHGSTGGTILPAHGTANRRWLKRLRLDDIRRDVVILLVRSHDEGLLVTELETAFNFNEANSAFCFSMPVSHALGTSHVQFDEIAAFDLEEDARYLAMITIVEERDLEDALDLIRNAGAPGATYIKAFGSANLSKMIFNVPAFDEKALILAVATKAKATAVADALTHGLDILAPGKGLLYTVPVIHVRGMANETEETV